MSRVTLHFVGICGLAMGPLAIALKNRGCTVTGSDMHARPPIAPMVEAAGIPIAKPCAAENLPAAEDTLVVCTKAVRPDNPEYQAARQRGLRIVSFPELLEEFFLRTSRNLVVAGTKGKSTTTAMLTWILQQTGHAPDYLFGGTCPGLPGSARFTGADLAVIEGDEYPAAHFDSAPKFVHYHPHAAALTNIYPEHADVYPTPRELLTAFGELLRRLPEDGALYTWAHADDWTPAALEAHPPRCEVQRLGWAGDPGVDRPVEVLSEDAEGTRFKFGGTEIFLPRPGLMNVRNAAQAIALAGHAGVEAAAAGVALQDFPGLNRRQQITGAVRGITIIDDEANHPRALEATLQSVRQKFPNRRLHLLYQPQFPGSRDGYFQQHLPDALAAADSVILAPAFQNQRVPAADNPFDPARLAGQLQERGILVLHGNSYQSLTEAVRDVAQSGDVVVVCVHITSCRMPKHLLDNL